ncbi:MAG: hypothetical protein NT159_20270 [Proteobacteria bacterium]|nr:hypothetical protein [Pseudomonadota bacterium]
MTTQHAIHRDPFGRFLPWDNLASDFVMFGSRVAAVARRVSDRLAKALRQDSFEEVYLSQAQNIADLENRMIELQSPHNHFSARYW